MRIQKFIRFFVSLVLISFLLTSCKTPAGIVKVHVLSLGYGDSVLVEMPDGKIVMIDTGPAEKAGHILEFLDRRSIKTIDAVFLTHPHENHCGGLEQLINHVTIRQFYTTRTEADETCRVSFNHLKAAGIPYRFIKGGDSIKMGNVRMKVIHPGKFTGDPNTDSMVIYFKSGKTSFLFCADIPPEIQKQIIRKIKLPDFVLLPHHGGDLDAEFVRWAADAVKVISTGPSPWPLYADETEKLFLGKVYRTDKLGDLTLISDREKIKFVSEKESVTT